MPRFKVCSALLVFAFVAFCSSLSATNVLQMNLQEMVNRSERIFRGTVLDVREGTVTAGGGELPVVTYRIRVEEGLKGTFEEVKGVQIAEVRMLGKIKPGQGSSVRTLVSIPDLPQLQVGHEYLLLVTPQSAIGLSTTVGLGQGLFELQGKDGQEVAINANKNYGLFLGINGSSAASSVNRTAASQEDGGALPYEGLAALIRDFVGE